MKTEKLNDLVNQNGGQVEDLLSWSLWLNMSEKTCFYIPIFIVFGILEFGQDVRTNNHLDRHGLFLLPGKHFQRCSRAPKSERSVWQTEPNLVRLSDVRSFRSFGFWTSTVQKFSTNLKEMFNKNVLVIKHRINQFQVFVWCSRHAQKSNHN